MNHNHILIALVALLISGQTHTMGFLRTSAANKALSNSKLLKERAAIIKNNELIREKKKKYFEGMDEMIKESIRGGTSWEDMFSKLKKSNEINRKSGFHPKIYNNENAFLASYIYNIISTPFNPYYPLDRSEQFEQYEKAIFAQQTREFNQNKLNNWKQNSIDSKLEKENSQALKYRLMVQPALLTNVMKQQT